MKFIWFIFSIGFFLITFDAKSQDAQFAQFNNSPLTLNPSLTGDFKGNIRLLGNYRNQWSSISAPYKTYGFTCDMGLIKEKEKKEKTGYLGIGVSFLSDRSSSFQLDLNQVNLSVAYHSHIARYSYLSAGIMGGYAQRSINFNGIKWDSQFNGNNYDPNLPSFETGYAANKSNADFGAGMHWSYKKEETNYKANDQLFINAGIAAFHLNQPNISFYSSAKDNLPIKVVVHNDYQIGIKHTYISLSPSFAYIQQGTQKNMMAGLSIKRKLIEGSQILNFVKGSAISLGGYYRVGDAIIPYILMEYANYAIGISYDTNVSKLTKATSGKGGIEIFLKLITLDH